MMKFNLILGLLFSINGIIGAQETEPYTIILFGDDQRPEYLQRITYMLTKTLIEDCDKKISSSSGIYRVSGDFIDALKQSREEAKIVESLFKNPTDRASLEMYKKNYKNQTPSRIVLIEISLPASSSVVFEARISIAHYIVNAGRFEKKFIGKGIQFNKDELTKDETVLKMIKTELYGYCITSKPQSIEKFIQELVELEIINSNDPQNRISIEKLKAEKRQYVLYLNEKANQYSKLISEILGNQLTSKKDMTLVLTYLETLDQVFNEMLENPNIQNKESIKSKQVQYRGLYQELKKK